MSGYRRNWVEGGTYFFTVVSASRRPIFAGDAARAHLRSAIDSIRQRFPFAIEAFVLLPDHLHTIWTLPPGDAKYATRWKRIKEEFTVRFLVNGGTEAPVSASRSRRGERGVWQRRYWEHTCDDADDFKHHLDYLHWNPVKHGLVTRVRDYPWSSFHRYVALGEYDIDWGSADPCPRYHTPEWE
ncbi:MAG: transposase [Gemmataceae bacterium]